MLEVQKYLRSGKSVDDLNAEFAINVASHPELPLLILNYDQIESKRKIHPIVRECRGLVLNTKDWSLVARSFPRFFNWGEVQEEIKNFDFSNFITQSKEDGSLVLIYQFKGKWHTNTRGSFGSLQMQNQNFSWQEGICKALNVNNINDLHPKLDQSLCYVCEFVSPWNKIVRNYDSPRMYLLTAFNGKNEIHHNDVDKITHDIFLRPTKYSFTKIEEIQDFLKLQASNDPTFEGVVICDHNNQRFKIKSSTYIGFHKIRGNGNNIFNPKNLLPFILTGEKEELLTYFSEVKETFEKIECQVQVFYNQIEELWRKCKDIENQKEFALAVKDHPFASVLFQTRKKYGKYHNEKELKKEFTSSQDLILKKIIN